MNIIIEHLFLFHLFCAIMLAACLTFFSIDEWNKYFFIMYFCNLIVSAIIVALLFTIVSTFTVKEREKHVIEKSRYITTEIPNIGYNVFFIENKQTIMFTDLYTCNIIKSGDYKLEMALYKDVYNSSFGNKTKFYIVKN